MCNRCQAPLCKFKRYNAGVGNDPLPDRKFNPKIQSERYDPNKIFQKLWLNTQYEIDL